MNRLEINERFAFMWRKSREDAGKSQDYIAKALGVSKKTVQNWESGFSSPTQEKGFEWFDVLGLQPLPYYLELLYGNYQTSESDKTVEDALITFIKACTPEEKRKLLFILGATHGSSYAGIIEMLTAHLHVPLKDRLNVAHNILTNYEIASAQGTLISTEGVTPNIDLLNQSYENAKEAVKNNKNSYSNVRKKYAD